MEPWIWYYAKLIGKDGLNDSITLVEALPEHKYLVLVVFLCSSLLLPSI